MRLRCIANSSRELPAEYLDPRAGRTASTQFPLKVDKEYTAYAVGYRLGSVWYYLADEDELPWPVRYPAPLFEVVDSRLSELWRFAFTPENKDHVALLAIREWTLDPYFYDRLTDGADREVMIFRGARHHMDGEARATPSG